MSDKFVRDHLDELKQMVKDKKHNQPVEEVLAVFCQRHGTSMDTCLIGLSNLLLIS
jgi:hypothetical protein